MSPEAIRAFEEEISKIANHLKAAAYGSGLVSDLGKTMQPPQVARALHMKPPASAASQIKVPSTIAAKASTATNLTALKSPSVLYR